nr:hypothetical protein CTI12_AA475510 [Tanacetum cinerariifolium]
SAQPHNDTSANVVHDTPSLADAETGVYTEKFSSEADIKILNVGEEQVHENLKLTTEEQVHIKNPPSSSGTLSSIKNLKDAFTFGDQFINNKSTEEEPGKADVETKFESMVTVPIHQASSSVPLLSTPIIDLTPPKPVSPPVQEPIVIATTITTTTLPPPPPLPQSTTDFDLANCLTTLEKRSANFEQKHQLQDKTTKALASRVYKLEHQYSKIDKQVNEKYFIIGCLKVTPTDRIRIIQLSMKLLKSPCNVTTMMNFMKYWLHLTRGVMMIKILLHLLQRTLTDAKIESMILMTLLQNSLQFRNDMHLLESEDTGATYLPNIKTQPDWLKPLLEEEAPETPKPDWVIPPNDLSEFKNNQADALAKTKLLPLGGPPVQPTVFHTGGSSARNTTLQDTVPPSDQSTVRSHMRILNVVSLKTFSRYGYTYLKEIVLRRADYKEYKISKADFKNLHLNDFKDMYLLHLQRKLKHLSGADKVTLSIAVNLWTGTSSSDNADRNDQKKMMRETEVHKFSDGTLARILEKMDYMVKDYKLFKFNPGIENRIWTEDDKRRSQELSS